jgi:hypothetical protein
MLIPLAPAPIVTIHTWHSVPSGCSRIVYGLLGIVTRAAAAPAVSDTIVAREDRMSRVVDGGLLKGLIITRGETYCPICHS